MPRLRSGRKTGSGDLVHTSEDSSLKKATDSEVEPETRQKQEPSAEDNEVEESDDEAPESVALSTSKTVAIAQRQDEREAIEAMKEKEKQRRKHKEEILMKQKEMRVNREKSRISNDILVKVAEKEADAAKKQEAQKSNVHTTFNDVDFNKEDTSFDKKGLQVVVIKQTTKRKPEIMESANEFLKNHFYGDRLKRVDTLKDENIKRRKKYFGPSVKFTERS